MGMKKNSGLEDILAKGSRTQETSFTGTKLRLVLLSELELATKLSNYQVLSNVGDVINKYVGRIDAIILNGGLAQIPNKYSKRRGERFDLLEDNLRETYGPKVYKEVKGSDKGSDSVDSIEQAVRLARVQMRSIYTAAKRKGIPIYYVFSENDYKNVSDIIGALEKLNAYMAKRDQDDKEEELPTEIKGVDRGLLSFVQKSYQIKASQWKNKDKQGVKDMALNMYKQWVSSIFSEEGEREGQKLKFLGEDSSDFKTMKRLENDIEINGVKIRAMHSINGLYSGNNESKPTERGTIMAVETANKDAVHGRLPDVYIRSHESSTDFTALDFPSRKGKPVYLLNSGPLQDMDAQIRRHASWNRTTEAKRIDQLEDSGMVIFSLGEDYRVDLQHVDFGALREGVDITRLEKNAAKELYKTVQIGDAHVGAPSVGSAYESIEAIPLELEKSKRDGIPKERSYLFSLGDMLHAGSDKASWTDILWPQRGTRDEIIARLKEAKTKEEKAQILKEIIHGVSTPDLGKQIRELDALLLSKIAPYFDTAYVVDGNHVEKAAGNAGESGMIGPILQRAGTTNIVYPDQESRANRDVYMANYGVYSLHSPGFRGGVDAGTALANKVVKTGNDNVDLVVAGDCHEPHIKYFAKKNGDRWVTLLALTSAALQDVTEFEKKKISKNKYTRGFEITYIPVDPKIGTGYLRTTFIPEIALGRTLKENGGSELEKIVKQKYS